MLLIICLGFMFGGAVIAGLTVGKTLKRFFIGAEITLLSALPLIFLAVFKMDMLKDACISYLQQNYANSINSVGTFIPGLITAPKIPSYFVWFLVIAFILFTLFVYIAAFNCRKNANNIYAAIGGTILAGVVIYFCTVWGFYGLSTFIQLLQRYSDKFPTATTVITTIILTVAILAAWTIFSFRSKRQGWKILSIPISLFAGIYAVIWLLAFTTAHFYGRYAVSLAHKNGVTANHSIYESSKKAQAEKNNVGRFLKKHRDFELPYSSIYSWTKDGSSSDYGKPITQAKREYTLKYFDSADFAGYYRSREKLLEYYAQVGNKNTLLFYLLNDIRACVRIHAGVAAMYKETNQPEKILPELMKTTWIDADLLNDSPFLIVEMIRITCRAIWYNAMVQVGPNDKKYAPVYREALDFMKSRKVNLPHEAGYFLNMLINDIHIPFQKKLGKYVACLVIPPTTVTVAKGLLNSLSIRKELKRMKKQEVFENDEQQPDNTTPKYYRAAALKSKSSIVMGTTALALKLYRVENGPYPNKLERLVPKYLDSIPLCPFSGKLLKYESDGRSFTLSYGAEKHRNIYKLTSNPTY